MAPMQLGVPCYWILDPDAQCLECYRDESGTFVLSSTAAGGEAMASAEFPGPSTASARSGGS